MKKLLIAIALFASIGCQHTNHPIIGSVAQETPFAERYIEIYVIDSCEYIGSVHGGNSDVLAHKGNCKYCLKRNNR